MAMSKIFPRGKLEDPNASWMERVLSRLFVREEIPTRVTPTRLYLRRFKIFDPRRKVKPGEATNAGKQGGQGKPWFSWFRIYLHVFYVSDLDPDPHDHPWPFASLILKGGYTDETWRYFQDGPRVVARQVCNPGKLAIRRATHIHRVQLKDPTKRTWTLVLSGRRYRTWYFYTQEGRVRGEDYKGAKVSS